MIYVMVRAREALGLWRRIAGLCEHRRHPVRGMSAGPAGRGFVRFTLEVDAPPERASLLARQLRRLADVVEVEVAADDHAVSRELALIKVCPPPGRRSEVLQVAQVFRARVVDAGPGALVVEVTGTAGKIEAMIALLEEFRVTGVARGGAVALHRGSAAAGAAEPSGPDAGGVTEEAGAHALAGGR
ncbi:MAG TPA: acetolactate synthase small subunit [Bacillota bacterium]